MSARGRRNTQIATFVLPKYQVGVTVLFKKSFWKMLQHFLFFAKLRSAQGPPGGALGPRGPRPPARIGSKASWQIALGPH